MTSDYTETTFEPTYNNTKSVEDEDVFRANQVFINQLDSFNGKHIANILADKIFRDRKTEFAGEEVGEEEEDEPPPVPDVPLFTSEKERYQIVGTALRKSYKPTEDITKILTSTQETREKFYKDIMNCAFVVYDISQDEDEIPKALATLQAIEKKLDEMEAVAPKKFKNLNEMHVFVLISTVMTWAKTRPVDPEDPDVPFVETDFRKRKPHPNYKKHIELEKEVIQKGKKHKDHLRTIVIASGLTYGEEEYDLCDLFKMAWYNEIDLPVIQSGSNVVPLINIKDLASILYGIFENVPKKSKYILAVEQTSSTQKQIMRALSKSLGTGRLKFVSKEEALLYPKMTQYLHERINVNLKMEPGYIVSELDIPWTTDMNFCENIHKIVKEFLDAAKLHPINVIIHGPPAVGKTTIAKKLAEYYNSEYMSITSLITDTLKTLRANIEYARTILNKKMEKKDQDDENVEEEEEEEDDEDMEAKVEEWTDKLKLIERGIDENENGRLPDYLVVQLLKEKLQSNQCQNHGYILDGYPKTDEQARAVFEFDEGDEPGEEQAEEEEEGDEPKKNIFPHFIVTLEATDDFLCNRVMQLPEAEVQGTHYTEEHMIRRLETFRNNNTDENTMLNVFDEREIHPYVINAETDNPEDILALIKMKMGMPIGFPPSPYELEELLLKEEEARKIKEETEQRELEEEERLAREEHDQRMQQWAELLQALQQEEQQQLTAQCKPLREYLIRFVFPTLTRGLLETARIKPEDPVDFLAEYLFKENPEGRMFDPAYVAAADEMFKAIEEFRQRLGD